jgi:hypothetical protein
MTRAAKGYILVETMVGLTVLSIGALTVHQVLNQAMLTRAQARDYTQARFLMEGLIEELLVQPELKPGRHTGRFTGGSNRFSYAYEIDKVELPRPEIPEEIELVAGTYIPEAWYIGRIRAVIRWQRRGVDFDERMETLFPDTKLPPAERRPPIEDAPI